MRSEAAAFAVKSCEIELRGSFRELFAQVADDLVGSKANLGGFLGIIKRAPKGNQATVELLVATVFRGNVGGVIFGQRTNFFGYRFFAQLSSSKGLDFFFDQAFDGTAVFTQASHEFVCLGAFCGRSHAHASVVAQQAIH